MATTFVTNTDLTVYDQEIKNYIASRTTIPHYQIKVTQPNIINTDANLAVTLDHAIPEEDIDQYRYVISYKGHKTRRGTKWITPFWGFVNETPNHDTWREDLVAWKPSSTNKTTKFFNDVIKLNSSRFPSFLDESIEGNLWAFKFSNGKERPYRDGELMNGGRFDGYHKTRIKCLKICLYKLVDGEWVAVSNEVVIAVSLRYIQHTFEDEEGQPLTQNALMDEFSDYQLNHKLRRLSGCFYGINFHKGFFFRIY